MKPLVFLALCVLVTPLFGAPAMAAKDPIELYTRSSYTYCDAKVLAAHWGQSVWDAKTRIGKKIGWGDEQSVLRPMREQAGIEAARDATRRCEFYETEFSYEDAEKLSRAWNTSIEEAKASLALKASVQGEAAVKTGLLAPLPQPADIGAGQFVDSCHDKMLRHLWGTDSATVQSTVQRKVGIGQRGYIDAELNEARKLAAFSPRVACSFWDTPYTYSDAELLAGRWGQTVSDAKAMIAKKYTIGAEDWVKSELTTARGGR